jgi:protein-L-isoaspartate O-methyltransferase
MPSAGWWEALWPDPAMVVARVGIAAGMDVIDLCVGDGWFTLHIAKMAGHVTAIDIDRELLDVAHARLAEAGVTNCESSSKAMLTMLTNSSRGRSICVHGQRISRCAGEDPSCPRGGEGA